jgi:hypothetical protein
MMLYTVEFICRNILVTGSQSLFATVSGLLHRRILNSSASCPSQLPFPTLLRIVLVVVFLPVEMSLFA